MNDSTKHIGILCGSPRKGNSELLVSLLIQGIEEAGGSVETFFVREHPIEGCAGCDGCNKTGECVITKAGRDDFDQLEAMLERIDHLIVVSPVYFAGPPSQLKAVYDRFQSRWARRYLLGQEIPEKRCASMFVIGSGNDPFGFGPLVTITRSSLNIANFALGEVFDFIGFTQTPTEEMKNRAIETAHMLVLDSGKCFV